MKEESYLGLHKLSKRFFMSLPAGIYLVSNCHEMIEPGRYRPCFNESIVPPAEREAQWIRIKAAHADHRLCCVYRNSEDHKRSLQESTKAGGFPSFVIVEREKDL